MNHMRACVLLYSDSVAPTFLNLFVLRLASIHSQGLVFNSLPAFVRVRFSERAARNEFERAGQASPGDARRRGHAAANFEAAGQNELPVRLGDVLEILESHPTGWSWARSVSGGNCGWVPSWIVPEADTSAAAASALLAPVLITVRVVGFQTRLPIHHGDKGQERQASGNPFQGWRARNGCHFGAVFGRGLPPKLRGALPSGGTARFSLKAFFSTRPLGKPLPLRRARHRLLTSRLFSADI